MTSSPVIKKCKSLTKSHVKFLTAKSILPTMSQFHIICKCLDIGFLGGDLGLKEDNIVTEILESFPYKLLATGK